jgi:acetate kinase
MGFTALDGLMMGTRTGTIDPGVLLYLLQEKRLSPKDLERLLYRESGLLGVSGISHDMRALLASSDPRAKEAVDLFVYRIVREIGSLAAALGGLDLLVFTGGIGEHAASVREAIVEGTAWLRPFEVAVVPTNEEEMIARHTAALRQACASPRPSPVPA